MQRKRNKNVGKKGALKGDDLTTGMVLEELIGKTSWTKGDVPKKKERNSVVRTGKKMASSGVVCTQQE